MAPKAGEAATQGASAGKKPHCPSSPRDPDEDEIQVVKVQPGGLTLPTRVKEKQYERDDQRRKAVPLVAGEGRMVVKKLTAGAYGVRKIIEFRKPRGRGPAHVEQDGRLWPSPLAARAPEDNGGHRQGRLAAGREGDSGREGG